MKGRSRLDAVELQVFHHLLASIPEEMGTALRAAAFSPNIKERLDFSCAITAPDGSMAAQASHIPVHLGSAHITARHLLREVPMEPGDLVLVNDPWRGGTHLPDVTVFAPVFLPRAKRPSFGVIVRAHHADLGGATPGSMGPAQDVHGEGLVIPPVRFHRRGVVDEDLLAMVLANTRTPEERRGDLIAQAAAATLGRERLLDLAKARGATRLQAAITALQAHAASATRALLRSWPDGSSRAALSMDGPGTPTLRVLIDKRGDRLTVDFTGTDAEVAQPINANEAITLSCVFYAVRLLLGRDLPTNSGVLEPIEVVLPEGCLLNARRPSPVAGGNVETSQRLVDLLLAALAHFAPGRMPAASQGTMNNVTLGGRRADGSPFTFYETLGGGVGAGPSGAGESGLHSHMTNTLNTPIEALEHAIPVLLRRYALREGSGGAGKHRGGEGLVREFEARVPMVGAILATRRHEAASGAQGGDPGAPAQDRLTRDGRESEVPSGTSFSLAAGDRLTIATPGGGGFGRPG